MTAIPGCVAHDRDATRARTLSAQPPFHRPAGARLRTGVAPSAERCRAGVACARYLQIWLGCRIQYGRRNWTDRLDWTDRLARHHFGLRSRRRSGIGKRIWKFRLALA